MTRNKRESGNVFFMILIAIVLFAALMFAYSRGARQGTGNLDKLNLDMAAGEILADVQKVERRVSYILGKQVSEDTIDFAGAPVTGTAYANGNCTADACRVFAADGGIKAPVPDRSWLDSSFFASPGYGTWIYTSQFCIDGLQDQTCTPAAAEADLVMILPYLRLDLCRTLNEKLRLSAATPAAQATMTAMLDAIKFDGSYPADTVIGTKTVNPAPDSGARAACVRQSTDNFYAFYSVLISR